MKTDACLVCGSVLVDGECLPCKEVREEQDALEAPDDEADDLYDGENDDDGHPEPPADLP